MNKKYKKVHVHYKTTPMVSIITHIKINKDRGNKITLKVNNLNYE